MIILRADETQTLAPRTAMPNVQYAGEGQALAQAGVKVASTADSALQYSAALQDRQARTQAVNVSKLSMSKFEEGVNAYFYKWDQEHVQKGELPNVALESFEAELGRIEKLTYDLFGNEASGNGYLKDGLPVMLSEAKKDAMAKARAHAHKSFVEIGRTQTSNVLDDMERAALMADANGNTARYEAIQREIFQTIETQKANGLYNDQQAERLLQERIASLTEKRGYQQIARNPEQFLLDFHDRKYQALDPKLAKEFVTASEAALGRKVEIKDRERRLEKEGLEIYRTSLKNELISEAMHDPGTALTRALTQANRLALGPEFDNTISTLRTLANPDARHNDEPTLRELNKKIERNPTSEVYADLDRALKNGKLKGDTFMSMSHRLTERIEKMKDKNESDRLKRTNLSVDTYQPLLRVTGINDFDQTSNTAQQLFEDELRAVVEGNAAVDPMVEGKRLMIKYLDYIEDHATDVSEKMIQKYNVKSAQEALQKFQRGEISRTESDILIWAFERQKKESASTQKPASTSSMVKKK